MLNLLRRPNSDALEPIQEAVRAEQIRLQYQQLPVALAGSFVIILLVAAVLWGAVPSSYLLGWGLIFTLLTGVRALAYRIYLRTEEEDRDYARWGRWNLIGTGLAGAVAGGAGLFPALTGHHQELSFLVIIYAGLSATALSTNGSRLVTVLIYVWPLILPTSLALLSQGRGIPLALGAVMLLFAVALSLTATRYSQTLGDALRLRFRNNALYRKVVRTSRQARESTQELQEQMDHRESAERHLSAYAKRLQRTNEALQREVEERERNEQQVTHQALEILESEARIRAVFQNAFDAIITFNETGVIDSCNSATQTLFGYLEADLVGMSVSDLIPDYGGADTLRQVVEGEGVRVDGTGFPLAYSVDQMRVTGRTQFVCVVRDETQARETRQALVRAKDAAEAANRAKSEFLSSMSHELRTPLNAILGFTQLLQTDPMDPLSEGQNESVDQIGTAGWHLLRLINDVLDLAKIESGNMDTLEENVALQDVIQECLTLIQPNAEQKQIRLIDEYGNANVILRADYTRVKQVLLNLLSNAIKYNWEGGSVTVGAPEFHQGRCRLYVSDTGNGLSEKQIQVIFAPFSRVAENKEEIEGTGIGLTITRRLLDMMGGGIGVESRPGEGSCFWIELPLANSALTREVVSPAAQPNADGPALDPLRSYRVLYVEDNLANLKVVQSIIRRRRPNIELVSVQDGEAALEQALSSVFDLYLLDLLLPGISGFEILAALRQSIETRGVPAIAISANAMPEDREKGLAAGFARYLTKPIDMNDLLESVDEVLSR